MTVSSARHILFGAAGAATALVSLALTVMALMLPPLARADPEDCDETLTVNDPYALVWDTDVSVDLDTLTDVEGVVDDYTDRIDEALDAEYDDREPPDGLSSGELIGEAQYEIEGIVDDGRWIAGCED